MNDAIAMLLDCLFGLMLALVGAGVLHAEVPGIVLFCAGCRIIVAGFQQSPERQLGVSSD